MNTLKYYAVIQKDSDSDYGVIFPDFLNCITAGSTLNEVYAMAKEALEFHIENMIEDKELIPEPLTYDEVKNLYKNQYVEIIQIQANILETV